MKTTYLIVASVLLSGCLIAVCGTASAETSESASQKAIHEPAMVKSVYVCPDCHQVALEAGTCACGKKLVKMHLLGMKDGQAMLCTCKADCKCDAEGVKDGKCACGKEVKMASCKGLYCCPKGCPVMSEKSGKCLCGEAMVQCE